MVVGTETGDVLGTVQNFELLCNGSALETLEESIDIVAEAFLPWAPLR